jgi:4-methyl-5(b-hydroxyethyl)-thiazole monophosphate biosynthesis
MIYQASLKAAHRSLFAIRPSVRPSVRMASSKRVLVPIGEGTEEMEAVITIDVLRRAGASCVVASVEASKEVRCSRGVKLVADAFIQEVKDESWDLIACPGGMPGAERLRDSSILEAMVRRQREEGKLYAAICATPVVFFQAKG